MNIFRRPRPGRRQAELLLDGAGHPADPLTGLLAAARRPGPDAELPGERAALAAFRAAAAGTAHRPAEEDPAVSLLPAPRAIAVKVLAAAALTMTVGGVAVAATGALPGPAADHRSTVAASHAPSSAPGRTGKRPSASPTGRPADVASGRPDALRPGLDARAALLVDCRNAGRGAGPADDLVAAAGGAQAVPGFCAALVAVLCPDTRPGAHGERPTAVPGAQPGCPRPTRPADATGRPADATGRPADAPTGGPDGGPTDKPGGRPTDKPGGKPTDKPTDRPTTPPGRP